MFIYYFSAGDGLGADMSVGCTVRWKARTTRLASRG